MKRDSQSDRATIRRSPAALGDTERPRVGRRGSTPALADLTSFESPERRYERVERLGIGMGEVALARDVMMGREVALKTMLAVEPSAQAELESPSDEQFDFMSFLAKHGLHDQENERWNAYGQATYISSWKQGFRAKYTNLNGSNHSLSPDSERSFTGTATL